MQVLDMVSSSRVVIVSQVPLAAGDVTLAFTDHFSPSRLHSGRTQHKLLGGDAAFALRPCRFSMCCSSPLQP